MRKTRILTNLKTIDCCEIPLNGELVYFPTYPIALQTSPDSLTIRALQSCATMENTRLIARYIPLKVYFPLQRGEK